VKSPFQLNIEERPQLNFEEWCFYLCDAFDDEARGLLLTFLWVNWKSQNKWVFEGQRWGTLTMINYDLDYCRTLLEAIEKKQGHSILTMKANET